MGSRKTARRLLLTAVLLACASAGFGPSGKGGKAGKEDKVTKEQLAYSKQMFGEGEAAMKAKDYATALAKYYEGYRYAPHLHIFTYSIGAAAEASGDCRTAITYYRMFLDLVPEHPERKSVQGKYDKLSKTCRVEQEQESESVDAATDQAERARDRGSREREESMSDAVAQLGAAERMYATAASKYPDGPFKRAAKRKKKDAKRMRKLATKLAVKLDEGDAEDGSAGGTLKEACREGVRLEHRIIEALEAVLEHHEDAKAQKVGYRVLRGAERDETTFEGCR